MIEASRRSKRDRQLHLGVFVLAAGHHIGGWRLPQAESGGENLDLLKRIACVAERGLLDMLFLGDSLGTSANHAPSMVSRFEPTTLLSSLASVTSHLGLVATASTTYGEPYHLARQFASLDHISAGRAGWNIVTSSNAEEALNFGLDEQLAPSLRYERAHEFVEVVKGLWDSWEDGAFPRDKIVGTYIDKARLHTLNHIGPHFSVRGPLNIARAPQGQPVLIQAGSSAPGMHLAARVAEVVFTAQPTLKAAQAFYRDIKARVTAEGRRADTVLVMPGVMPIVGRTRAEAQALFLELQSKIDVSLAVSVLSRELGHDVSGYPLDQPLPAIPPTSGTVSRAGLLIDMATHENLSLRELALRAAAARGHHIFVGDAVEMADHLETWFIEGGADGFNLMPPYFPGGLEDFVDLVVPILQERGLFRLAYEGTTLRDRLGLRAPDNRYAAGIARQST
jgi:FMN-dependent oxidoreductase (nitrilotriacetate monooxygenase family)